ncbi:MAG TPA: VOC family protein, partial [Candidatus Acidoferrales bacterium]|nr:VOC family protein [Candidatus Acidoferrales bacterium]
MPASLTGIHHVTCITGDVQKNVDFYVSVLGLRFVKKSINQDVPDTYHLYFADYVGSPGTAMTFFGWPHLPKHVAGRGQVTTVSFALPEGSIDFWSERLRNLRVDSRRASRFDGEMILLLDPDGIQLELVESKPHSPFVPWKDGPVDEAHAIHGFYSVTLTVTEALKTVELLQKTMGFKQTKQEGNRTRFETGPRGQGSIADVIESPEAPVGEEGTGTVHHVAWRAKDEGLQQE